MDRTLDNNPYYVAALNQQLSSNTNTPSRIATDPFTIQVHTHAGVEACLADKHVVFLGDSRLRYQYMHLAHFLSHGQWMQCEDVNATSIDVSCTLIHEKTRQKWNEWYSRTTQMLNEDDRQVELCDCYRPFAFVPNETVENRFFRRTPTVASQKPIRLTYLQHFVGRLQIHAADFLKMANDATSTPNDQPCIPGNCSQPHTTMSLEESLSTVVPYLQPTHLFANYGWDDIDISCELQQFRAAYPDVQVSYVSHPLEKGKRACPRDHAAWMKCYQDKDHKEKNGTATKYPVLGILDRQGPSFGVPRNWYWDNLHLLSNVNRVFNQELLKQLCPL